LVRDLILSKETGGTKIYASVSAEIRVIRDAKIEGTLKYIGITINSRKIVKYHSYSIDT